MTFNLMTFAFKYEYVSALEGVLNGSSRDTLIFEVEIKSALEVTMGLHLKMHMVVRLLVQKSSNNNLIKGELEETLYVALEGATKISLEELQKIAKKSEKMHLTLLLMVHLTMQSRVHL